MYYITDIKTGEKFKATTRKMTVAIEEEIAKKRHAFRVEDGAGDFLCEIDPTKAPIPFV